MIKDTSSSKALLVMKVCLITSLVIGGLVVTFAAIAHKGFLEISASVIPLIAVQWFFYLNARSAKARDS